MRVFDTPFLGVKLRRGQPQGGRCRYSLPLREETVLNTRCRARTRVGDVASESHVDAAQCPRQLDRVVVPARDQRVVAAPAGHVLVRNIASQGVQSLEREGRGSV
jgi:hypothetical protein